MRVTKSCAIAAIGGALVLTAFLASPKKAHAEELTGGVRNEGTILETATWTNRASANVTQYADIKAAKDRNAQTSGILLPGRMVTVEEKGEAWSKISSNGIEGYVETANLVFGEEARVHYKNVCGFDAAVQTQGANLNVRAGADIANAVVGSLADGSAIEVLAKDKDWYRLDVEGAEEYVSAQYVVLDEKGEGAVTVDEYNRLKAEAEAAAQAKAQAEAQAAAEAEAAAQAEAQAAAEEAAQAPAEPQTAASGRGVSLSADEMNLFASLVQCEAGGESWEGKVAVAAVVINRMTSGIFPSSLSDVIYQGGQFAPTWNGSLDSVLAGGPGGDCMAAVQAALAGENPIGGCLYFNSGAGQGIQIGNQHFY